MATRTTLPQRLRQAVVTGLACLFALAGIMVLVVGSDGFVEALPLLLLISVIAAVVGGSVRPRSVLKQGLLGVVAAGAGAVAMLAYVVYSLSYR